MAKDLIITGYDSDVIDHFEKQIGAFMEDRTIVKAVVGSPAPEVSGAENVVLTTSFEAYKFIADAVGTEKIGDVIFAGITLSAAGLVKALGIAKGSDVIVYQNDYEIATRLCKTLTKLGVRDVTMTPAGTMQGVDMTGKCVATTHDLYERVKNLDEVYDLGYPVIDLETLLDIAEAFGIGGMLEKIDLMGAPSNLVPIHEGLFKNLESHNRYISSADLLIKMIAGAVISVDNDGSITAINGRCEKQFGIEARYVVGKNGGEIFPFIYFSEALEKHRSVEEYVCRYKDEDLIVSVEPKTNAGKYYGAVAVVKKYREEEKRHHKLKADLLDRGYRAKYTFDEIVGESEIMKRAKDVAVRMAKSDSSVLVTGENGTGKEMFAQAIHNASSRASRQFVAVNCGAIPANLLESELFGYEEGAFTGAKKGGMAGIFEMASTGTLFLDEISEMDMSLQKKLLRVLQEMEVVRLGGNYVIPVNCRIIASSNRNLGIMVANGEFREDLYYRLRVLPLRVPSLRERKDDIPGLIDHFAEEFGGHLEYSPSARNMIMAHQWWGNVRELRNCVEYLMNLGKDVVDSADVEGLLRTYPGRKDSFAGAPADGFTGGPNSGAGTAPAEGRDPGDQGGSGTDAGERGKLMREHGLSDDSVFVLRVLDEAFSDNRRMGRRSIAVAAKESGLFIGEQRARVIAEDLEKKGLVKIGRGKAGTVITADGRELAGKLI